jgi:exodeoxyribonuclease V beta subunit
MSMPIGSPGNTLETAAATAAFDLFGELPTGTTVLEASAGTGKTFTIAALVARFVAEDRARLDQMLIVTFSRAATGELRERVRERLTSAERRLGSPEAARSDDTDPLVQLLASVSDDEVALRRRRLRSALTTFDAATIATTHQFCSQVLAGLGVTAELAGADRFMESLDTLVEQVVDDLYLRKFAAPAADDSPNIPHDQARKIAREVFRDPQARLEPASAPPDSPAGVRRRLAEAVRGEVAARKRLRGIRSYDDLQTDLARVLTDPSQGPANCRRLQARFHVVLIDEFQDTDPVQWEIVKQAFVGHSTVVLIGDPKQAIYGFRGADVTAYLKAAEAADQVATLERNWRSEPGLLRAFDALFGHTTFGDPQIAYRVVQAARTAPQLTGAPVAAPLRLRIVSREAGEPLSGKGLLIVDRVRPQIADDVACDIVRLLESHAQVLSGDDSAQLQPGDIAVLVRTNSQANLVREALRSHGVPAVIGGASSVFTTPVGREWLMLLEALEQPHRAGRVKAAAMTCFLGWSAERLATALPTEVDALSGLIRGWATVLTAKGVAALQETITATQGLPARLLSEPDGERRLTDLRHIGEALHAAAAAEGLGITALVAWLRERIKEADEAVDGVLERTRRLDSDADAVQVVTIHRSKGLEFPVVYVPFAWDQYKPDIERPHFHDPSGQRVLDVGSGLGGSDPAAFSEGVVRHNLEEAGEQLRLLYVAVTRARSQAVLWWVPGTTSDCAPLSRLLFGQGGTGEPELTIAVPSDAEADQQIRALASAAAGDFVIERSDAPPGLHWSGHAAAVAELRTADFDRVLDSTWRRTSYSGLTALAHELGGAAVAVAAVSSEPEEGALDDEPVEETPLLGGVSPLFAGDVLSPMATLPGGAAFGSLVHAVLEEVDPGGGDLEAQLREGITEQLTRWGSPGPARAVIDPDVLADSLLAVYDSPLGPLAAHSTLRHFTGRDRLTELNFELPLAGGDVPGGALRLGALGPVLARHLGARDPLKAYSERLSSPLLRDQPLRGFLNGSLDAILRVREGESVRYVVVDYKTNWLSAAIAGSGQLTAADYTPERMADSMLGSDYPLQALLYSVALHRYLRWRQPGYTPEQHLGGALYLYLRGMCGRDTPVVDGQPCGVFAWKPPAALVTELSDLLDSGGT